MAFVTDSEICGSNSTLPCTHTTGRFFPLFFHPFPFFFLFLLPFRKLLPWILVLYWSRKQFTFWYFCIFKKKLMGFAVLRSFEWKKVQNRLNCELISDSRLSIPICSQGRSKCSGFYFQHPVAIANSHSLHSLKIFQDMLGNARPWLLSLDIDPLGSCQKF